MIGVDTGTPQASAAAEAHDKSPRGPVLSLNGDDFILTERGKSRVVVPHLGGDGSLRIGCTTIDPFALKRLREFLDGEDAMQKDAEHHDA